MRKTLAVLLALLALAGLFAACSNNTQSGPYPALGADKDYAEIVQAVHDSAEDPLKLPLVTSADDLDFAPLAMLVGLSGDSMQRFALYISSINIKAYAIAVILPKEGSQQEVIDQLNAFIEAQINAFDGYLQDQYEIAKTGMVKQVQTGEVLLAMTADSAGDMAALEDALAG